MTARLIGAEALQRRLKAIAGPDASARRMRLLGTEVVARAKRGAPQKTRNLNRTISVTHADADSVTVEAGAAYAGYVEFGTRPHDIRPKPPKKALAFAWGVAGGPTRRLTGSTRTSARGSRSVYRVVHHPGTRAQPFLRPAAASTIADAGDIMLGQVVIGWNGAA